MREVSLKGLPVSVVPGPSAVLGALAVSGLPTDRFFFAGFLPPKSAARRRAIKEIAQVPGSLVFFEAPSRLAECLADLADMLGEREAAVARELTKLHEETQRGTLRSLTAQFQANPARGEIVVVVGPAGAREATGEDLDTALRGSA